MKMVSTSIAVAMIAAAGLFAGCTKAESSSEAQAPKQEPAAAQAAKTSEVKAAAAQPDKVIAYYFHGNRRCRTCLGLQEIIAKTIRERFAAETASGVLTFQEINFEQPENQHFVKDFSLSFSTMVLVAQRGQEIAKWQACDVWNFAHEPEGLADYTEKQIRSQLAMLGAR